MMSAAFFFNKNRKGGSEMAVFTGNNHKGKTQKERIKEIIEQLEAGVVAVFERDAYRALYIQRI